MKRLIVSFMALTLAVLMFTGLAEPVFADGASPIAENLELCTYKGVSVGGNLSAFDPDGDELSYQITTDPVKGSIVLSGDGSFVYTPGEKKRGRDYFGYKAVDSDGNMSQEATVIIKIEKQKSTLSYSDMEGNAAEYAAVLLSERGILTGEQLGGQYCFYPESPMTRGEFISMCMLISGEKMFNGVMSTGYADDEDIPGWMKTYVATAAMCGIDCGKTFSPAAPITAADAVVMLNKALGFADVSYMSLDEALDEELAQSCANLSAGGILREEIRPENGLSRAEAAQMLAAAIEMKDSTR